MKDLLHLYRVLLLALPYALAGTAIAMWNPFVAVVIVLLTVPPYSLAMYHLLNRWDPW